MVYTSRSVRMGGNESSQVMLVSRRLFCPLWLPRSLLLDYPNSSCLLCVLVERSGWH